jgi:tRNA/tmRNA/rRNA uracil-C5-methylase (TrmA/RlmC/RlmD family)
LQENGIDSYDELKQKASAVSGEHSRLSREIREKETRQKEITELQKQIGNYGKSRAVHEKYKACGYDQAFFEANRAALTLYKAAKNYFNEQGFKGKAQCHS